MYPSLLGSGFLDRLLSKGVKYLFVSNSDNLGATLDVDLLAYFAKTDKAFIMEVSPIIDLLPLSNCGNRYIDGIFLAHCCTSCFVSMCLSPPPGVRVLTSLNIQAFVLTD